MKKTLFLLFAMALFASCTQINKKNSPEKLYEYKEVKKGKSGPDISEPVAIYAPNDTIAYFDAYTRFVISLKVYNDMSKDGLGEYLDKPVDFLLINENGDNIRSIDFPDKESREREIYDSTMKLTLFEQSGNTTNNKNEGLVVDSSKIKELLPYFKTKKDEFSKSDVVWYEPKSRPAHINRNGVFCYFQTKDGRPCNFRFSIQYSADDWLFFKKVYFSIDSSAYEYIPLTVETDNGGSMIWEWFDESITSYSDIELIRALASAKQAKMKLVGRQYYTIKTITPAQIKDIKRTLELYEAMGGRL